MWIPLSFLYAFFDSLQNIYYKQVSPLINPVLMAWSVLVISAVCYLPLFFFGIPALDTTFWVSVLFRLVIDSIAFTLFITGVQKSPLSLTIPTLSIIPVLSIFTVFFTTGIAPSMMGAIGVVITMLGLYFLNFDYTSKHPLSPFFCIAKERGVLMVVIASLLWSLVVSLQKIGIDHSSAYFYTAFFQLIWAICFAPVAYFYNKTDFVSIFTPKSIKLLFPAGLLDAIKNLLHNVAYTMTIPAYVNTIGNTGMLISTVMAAILFKEKITSHVVPIIIIFIGITILILG